MSNFYLPEFTLPPQARRDLQNVITMAGIRQCVTVEPGALVADIEDACRVFLGYQENNDKQSKRSTVNVKLRQLGEHLQVISELLSDDRVRQELALLVQDDTPGGVVGRYGIGLQGLKQDAEGLAITLQRVKPLGRGKPKGPTNPALTNLAANILKILEKSGLKVSPLNWEGPGGLMIQIFEIIREPIMLGNEGAGIFDEAARKRNK